MAKDNLSLVIVGIVVLVAVVGVIVLFTGSGTGKATVVVSEGAWRGWTGSNNVLPAPIDTSGTCCSMINYVPTPLFSAANEEECFEYGRAERISVYFKQGHYEDVCEPSNFNKESRYDWR